MPVLIIDNYDSFTFNLVHMVAAITGEAPIVVRNDEMTWEQLSKLSFDRIVISPGPGRPDRTRDFGVSGEAIMHATTPVLGVCLGHQGIASCFGGVVDEIAPMHGRASEIIHSGDELFRGIPERFSAIRYHSLGVLEPLPPMLGKIAWLADGTVMALRHRSRPLWGVQFHPESISSEYGYELLRNFLGEHTRIGLMRTAAPPACSAEPVQAIPLPYPSEVLFRALYGQEPYAFWLDSSLATERSRFSYMGASDEIVDTALVGRPFRAAAAFPRGVHTDPNAFSQIDELLAGGAARTGLPFPFSGGYVGYFGYECYSKCPHPRALPDSVLLRVERFLAIDHRENLLYVVGPGEWVRDTLCRIARIEPEPVRCWNLGTPVTHFSISRPEYLDKIRQCLRFIEAGESYELCLTNKLLLQSNIPALDYYETLRRLNPARYCAFLRLGDFAVASSSPECFLRIDEHRRAESGPIKGTIRRGNDPVEDEHLRDLLASNERFRAENLMIVDLVRHDLSRVSEVGTVRVPRLMRVETYATLHQLVSTIEGQLCPDATTGDCLRALFPGGSMTGAPKLRSIELLEQLEPDARGIYAGAIGYLGFNGTADLSIVIRTAVFHQGQVTLGVGGAIVAQSDPDAEWDEMELKAQALLRAFEQA